MLIECLLIGERADDGQVIGTGAAKGCPPLQGVRVDAVGVEALGEVAGDLFEQAQVADVLTGGRGQIDTVKVETGAQGMFAATRGRDVTVGADHGIE
ncbi:hypothetical protein D9M71_512620 [compost metagenome]